MKRPKFSNLAQDTALQRSPKGDVSREQAWSNIPGGVCWVLVAGRSYLFFKNFLATPRGRWNHSSPSKDQTHALSSGSRGLTMGKKSWKNYLCKTQFPYLQNGNSDGIMRIPCRNAVKVQYLALGIVAVQWQAAALPQ